MFNAYLLVISKEVLYLKASNLGVSPPLCLSPCLNIIPFVSAAAAAFAASKTFIILSFALRSSPLALRCTTETRH